MGRSFLKLLHGGAGSRKTDATQASVPQLSLRDSKREIAKRQAASEAAGRELSDVRAVAAALARDPQLTDAERLRLGDVLARWFADASADDPNLQDALEAQLGGGAA
jgi:hypothetical protein